MAGGGSEFGFFGLAFEAHFCHDDIDGQGLCLDTRHLVHLGGKFLRHLAFEQAILQRVIFTGVGDADAAHGFTGGACGVHHNKGLFAKGDDFAAHGGDFDVGEKVVAAKLLVEVVAAHDLGQYLVNDAQAFQCAL